MEEEHVFKALADSNRRTLLDSLFNNDGQTLGDLCTLLDMSRYGVMKHLRILEEAGLITTKKIGREKFHYLNPVPIQLTYDRWVSKYAQPWSQALTGLKFALEESTMNEEKPTHVFRVFIRTTPDKLWQALTDGSMTAKYYFGTEAKSTWKVGDTYEYRYANDGGVMIDGEVLETDPPHKLVTTFHPMWNGEKGRELKSRVTYEIEQMGLACRLTVTHEALADGAIVAGMIEGWQEILSGLKTLLETGEPLIVQHPTPEAQ